MEVFKKTKIFEEPNMQQILEVSKTIGGMPTIALVALIILGAFGLAAYTISAMLKVTKGRRDAD
jgi:putative effector of murein hydrolase